VRGLYFHGKKAENSLIVIPRSLRRGISNIRYYYTFRFTKRSLAALGMTIRIFYEGIEYRIGTIKAGIYIQPEPRCQASSRTYLIHS
jgi:hypothetical protein